jgi:hypothetical protein
MSTCYIFLGDDPENNPQGILDCIWNDFKATYAPFEDRGIYWDQVYEEFSPVPSDMNEYDLFLVCSNMIDTLNDPHSSFIESPFEAPLVLNDENYSEPFNLFYVKKYLIDEGTLTNDEMILWGLFKPTVSKHPVGYINISGFDGNEIGNDGFSLWVKTIDDIIQFFLMNTDSIVLDIRNNTGGFESNMEYLAKRFIAEKKTYLKSCARNGPGYNDFTDYIYKGLEPAETPYTKSTVLLTNKGTISAAEWFTLVLRIQDHVTHIGGPTRGALSARIVRPLINGWKYTLSIQKVRGPEGEIIEGRGIQPKILVSNTWDELSKNKDRQLEEAISLLNQ